jgi:hypothetical protein
MKILKSILSIIIIALLTIVYMVDRIICVFLPWRSVEALQNWLPKSDDPDQIKKEFTYMSDEAIEEMVYTRKFMVKIMKVSFVRVAISVFTAMCFYVIFM